MWQPSLHFTMQWAGLRLLQSNSNNNDNQGRSSRCGGPLFNKKYNQMYLHLPKQLNCLNNCSLTTLLCVVAWSTVGALVWNRGHKYFPMRYIAPPLGPYFCGHRTGLATALMTAVTKHFGCFSFSCCFFRRCCWRKLRRERATLQSLPAPADGELSLALAAQEARRKS